MKAAETGAMELEGGDKPRRGGTVPSRRGVYSISVAAELTGIEPHTLRGYERAGLLTPGRSRGGNRRYSDFDLHRLRRIAHLVASGLNTAGIRRVLTLEDENTRLRKELERADTDNGDTPGST